MQWSEAYNALRDMLGEQPIAHFAARSTYGAIKASRDNGLKVIDWPLLQTESVLLQGYPLQPAASPSDLDPDRRLTPDAARVWWYGMAQFADKMQAKGTTPDAMIAFLRSMPADNAGVMIALDKHMRAQLAATPTNTSGAIATLPDITPQPGDPVPTDRDARGAGDDVAPAPTPAAPAPAAPAKSNLGDLLMLGGFLYFLFGDN